MDQLPRGVVLLKVALPEGAVATAVAGAEANGTTKTQWLREAIALKDFVDRQRKDGTTFLMKGPGGSLRKVVFEVS